MNYELIGIKSGNSMEMVYDNIVYKKKRKVYNKKKIGQQKMIVVFFRIFCGNEIVVEM